MATNIKRLFGVACVVAGVGALFLGGSLLSNATSGVGVIGAACFLGIVARLAQASAHHDERMKGGQ
jgi:hypothetical protein